MTLPLPMVDREHRPGNLGSVLQGASICIEKTDDGQTTPRARRTARPSLAEVGARESPLVRTLSDEFGSCADGGYRRRFQPAVGRPPIFVLALHTA